MTKLLVGNKIINMREKATRNKKLYRLRKENKLSYRQLAKIFDIDIRQVYDICKRLEGRDKKKAMRIFT